jgi:hypothetical protein
LTPAVVSLVFECHTSTLDSPFGFFLACLRNAGGKKKLYHYYYPYNIICNSNSFRVNFLRNRYSFVSIRVEYLRNHY